MSTLSTHFLRNSTMASRTDLPPSPKDLLIASHDVLVLIFKLFIAPVPVDTPKTRFTRGGRKQLLNLALTCKAFVDPALECLWSHLESLEPLFKLHPGLKTVGDSCVRPPSIPRTVVCKGTPGRKSRTGGRGRGGPRWPKKKTLTLSKNGRTGRHSSRDCIITPPIHCIENT